ncbi:hypothetical protein GQ55_1G256000 [Panicum hallii var. hallii]|uniref:Uncharacterized protein n=1 Tax=Panicum hallii var. hallii TaxID=1504633 RepID=A0A2T7F7E1_9POAL|nr:hypothetical protein GQ55_1G256000 [Panicum hallii var. hallii]
MYAAEFLLRFPGELGLCELIIPISPAARTIHFLSPLSSSSPPFPAPHAPRPQRRPCPLAVLHHLSRFQRRPLITVHDHCHTPKFLF